MYDSGMFRTLVVLCGVVAAMLQSTPDPRPSKRAIKYELARTHEIKPHRRNIPVAGVEHGFNQLHITLKVSPTGDVVDAEATGDPKILANWPQLEPEVRQWKFIPFEENGKPVAADVEEYVDLVPPQRLPKKHVPAPVLKTNSRIEIALMRSGCFGSCPSYKVTASNPQIVFDGHSYVVAQGKHKDSLSPRKLRMLARKFIAADFYSMDDSYQASVTDCPTYVLSISIDGRAKQVVDYMGAWVGMPSTVTEIEDEVDELAGTKKWINGSDGLVEALQSENFDFKAYAAQAMLREAAHHGEAATVRGFLENGTSLVPLPKPKSKDPDDVAPAPEGWLTAASRNFETVQVLISAGASNEDQRDKNMALAEAARVGNLETARALIANGADPNADLREDIDTERSGGMEMGERGAGSILIYAAESGNPEMVQEILRYKPKLEMRDPEGKTAMFAAGTYRYNDEDDARVKCVQLLAQAGADVNARDNGGNTPLHETFLTDVEEELLKLGAEVNARNDDGETPIFTNVDDSGIALFIAHGADLTIRNKKGQTVMEAAREKGPAREEALRKAIQEFNERPSAK